MPSHLQSKNSGFTLFEVLIVLVLVGIFVTLAVVQHATSDASLIAQTEVLKSHIRYAQMRSINSDNSWGIYYNYSASDSGDCYYLLFSGNNIANVGKLPGETQDRVYLGNMGMTLEASIGSNAPSPQSFQIAFDTWGRPSSVQLDVTGTRSYNLNMIEPGHTPQLFVITRNTGFID